MIKSRVQYSRKSREEKKNYLVYINVLSQCADIYFYKYHFIMAKWKLNVDKKEEWKLSDWISSLLDFVISHMSIMSLSLFSLFCIWVFVKKKTKYLQTRTPKNKLSRLKNRFFLHNLYSCEKNSLWIFESSIFGENPDLNTEEKMKSQKLSTHNKHDNIYARFMRW